jgi:hypothetical protein
MFKSFLGKIYITIIRYATTSLLLFVFFLNSLQASVTYGQEHPTIGTFPGERGNWSFWIGWDASFSETYNPESESYAWVIYMAPEAVYVALQSSKSVYSGIDVNAGYKYFYGAINIPSSQLSASLISNDLKSVSLSTNMFSTSAGIGVGAFSNLSFALTSGLTFLKGKDSNLLQRGIQLDSGLSISYELISNPLPFSVSLGTNCDEDDAPELCKFHGFYPIIIWDINQQNSQGLLDAITLELQKTGSMEEYPLRKMLLNVFETMKSNSKFVSFIESTTLDSQYDTTLNRVQEWLDNGNTDNLPNIEFIDPILAHQTMKPILSTTQMGFELAYQRGCVANPNCTTEYSNCTVEVECKVGQECIIEITAEEIAAKFPKLTPDDLEESWVWIDNPIESYLTSGAKSEKSIQIIDGKASYSFALNSETQVVLGVAVDPCCSPVDHVVELCTRVVTPKADTGVEAIPAMLYLLLNN